MLYRNTTSQIILLGFVCFMCPGLYNALNGLGGAGQVSTTTAANANVALLSTSAVTFAFFAGSVNNVLGSKLTLLLGSLGYTLYIGSFLAVNIHPGAGAFVITAGAILGLCASLLWTAQGSLMLAYPTEDQKGRFIAIFWSIFNLGGVVGASVSLGQNFHSKVSQLGIYISSKIIRSDGTRVKVPRHPSWKAEFYNHYIALATDPWIILLFPMFFTSNWFYTWQFNDFNGALFNIRARSLNNLLYWLSQMIGSILIGLLLDEKRLRRRLRAFVGWIVLMLMVFVVHTWAYFYQKEYTREQVTEPGYVKIDIFDKPYVGRVLLYVCCGILDAMWQTTAYWLMGAMSNSPAKLAHLTGFYKSLQCAGAAGVWRADAVRLPYMNIFISTWVLLVAGLVFALPMIYMRVTDHTDEKYDNAYVHTLIHR
ncbi:hypothetical protein BDW22DRAFT_1406574 [Trametopsis cervina]|nr:hypothetical protein BDW22DRAFT_1406574 [Trametopsis cervina]